MKNTFIMKNKVNNGNLIFFNNILDEKLKV